MQQPPVQPFDDPALKAALRRTLDQPTAPAALRDRIRALATESRKDAGASDTGPIPIRPRRSPFLKLAVAAVLILGVGNLAYQIWSNRKPAYDFATAVPDPLYAAMVQTHAGRTSGSLGADTATTLDAAAGLASQIKRPVLLADLTKDGWAFQGGAVRNVGAHQAAQLFFTKGNATISVFSLPSAAA